MKPLDGNAIVYCQDAFNTPNGKTAHGLVRYTSRYTVESVIDSNYSGQDSGMVLDNKKNNTPVLGSLEQALEYSKNKNVSHFVIGLAPDGGRLQEKDKDVIKKAIKSGLNIDCGLHDFLSDDPELVRLARENNIILRDVRKPPSRENLHFYAGRKIPCLKVAVLGTDSAIGKRTTAWLLVHALQKVGANTCMIGTGQTAWMQGAKYSVILDSIVNDFVTGEIEHQIWCAWESEKPDVIVIEGQGSLMNPAYPGGLEIIAAGQPDVIVLQHAPGRHEYDGFPGFKIHPLPRQIQAVEILSGKPVAAITINHENLEINKIDVICSTLETTLGVPCFDVLFNGADDLAGLLVGLTSGKDSR